MSPSKCGRHIEHREEARGLSVGSDRVDTGKIPGMLRKHSLPGSQTEEEGNKGMETHIPTCTGGIQFIKIPVFSTSNIESLMKYMHTNIFK